jgi:hypothetical protein
VIGPGQPDLDSHPRTPSVVDPGQSSDDPSGTR